VHHRSDAVAGVFVGAATALVGRHFWPVKPHGPADMLRASAPALATGEGLTVVVNQRSGTAAGFQDTITDLLPDATIVSWDPASEPLADLIGLDVRAIGVAGGDGTTASVAELAAARQLPLAVFPRGTFNHFAKALGLHTDADTAAVIGRGSAAQVDLAAINGVTFLNTASLGGYPGLVRRRDRLSRQIGKWPAAAYALYRTLRHHTPMDLVINGREANVWVVFIGNGIYRPRGLAPAWREQLSAGVLDVQYLRADVRYARTRAIVLSLLGLVERSPVFGELQAPQVTIVSQSGPLPAAHDGEVTDPVGQVELTVAARALTVYC
jgi:diacylglycerol kinase family enzyme